MSTLHEKDNEEQACKMCLERARTDNNQVRSNPAAHRGNLYELMEGSSQMSCWGMDVFEENEPDSIWPVSI